jgi:hypothetical protein
MNNENLLYALLGGSIVALAWVASVTLTMQALWVGLGIYAIAAALFVAVQDYRDHSSKSLR